MTSLANMELAAIAIGHDSWTDADYARSTELVRSLLDQAMANPKVRAVVEERLYSIREQLGIGDE